MIFPEGCLPSPPMGVLSAVQAGRYLGVNEKTVRNWINRGELAVLSTDPIRLDSAHVDEVLRARQADAVADLVRRHRDPVFLAHEARRVLHPRDLGTNLPQDRAENERRRLSLVSDTARTIFGNASLTAALLTDDSCRWCRAADFATVLNTWAPTQFSEGFRALFDQEPCEKCAPGLYAPLWEALRSRVHPPGTRPSAPAPRASAAEREMAEQWARQRAVTAAAKPSRNDDDGRAWVAKRLRTERERLKAAKRSGDQRRAIQLRRAIQSLEADAARLDGRPTVTAAASRPGRLACGHLLAARCACPRPSKRGQR